MQESAPGPKSELDPVVDKTRRRGMEGKKGVAMKKMATVKYNLPWIEEAAVYAAPGSLKLDLRRAAKRSPLYFKEVNVPQARHLGGLLFGMPQQAAGGGFRGLFQMTPIEEKEGVSIIEVGIDEFRLPLFSAYEEDIIRLIDSAIDTLIIEGVIEEATTYF